MFGTIVSLAVILVLASGWYIRRTVQRRTAERTMYVPNRPGIELAQRYGGWDADPYDAGTSHAHRSSRGYAGGPGSQPAPSVETRGYTGN